jgi:hypothetical protein
MKLKRIGRYSLTEKRIEELNFKLNNRTITKKSLEVSITKKIDFDPIIKLLHKIVHNGWVETIEMN